VHAGVSRRERNILRTGAGAGAAAGILSGIPSTVLCLVRGRDPLEAAAAAGSILLPGASRKSILLLAAIPVHTAMSVMWATLMAATLPSRRTVLWGAVGGLAIAALDLGPLAGPFPRIRALPRGPQVADHFAFGVVAAVAIDRSRRKAGHARPGTVVFGDGRRQARRRLA
jgi:hypothetical protein